MEVEFQTAGPETKKTAGSIGWFWRSSDWEITTSGWAEGYTTRNFQQWQR